MPPALSQIHPISSTNARGVESTSYPTTSPYPQATTMANFYERLTTRGATGPVWFSMSSPSSLRRGMIRSHSRASSRAWFGRGAKALPAHSSIPRSRLRSRQERRAATDDDRIAEHAQLVDEAELDRRRGQAGAADLDVLVGRVECRGDLFGERRLGEPGVALDTVERAAEDDLRERAPDVGEGVRILVVAQRRIGLPRASSRRACGPTGSCRARGPDRDGSETARRSGRSIRTRRRGQR
jgi:hypothetical protein